MCHVTLYERHVNCQNCTAKKSLVKCPTIPSQVSTHTQKILFVIFFYHKQYIFYSSFLSLFQRL